MRIGVSELKIKIRGVCILLLLMILLVPLSASAAVDSFNIVTWGDDAPYVYYSSNGTYRGVDLGSGSYTVYKYFINGDNKVPVYCAQLGKLIANNVRFTRNSSGLSGNSKEALIIGKGMELIKNEYSDTYERYLYTTEFVNYVLKYNGYKDFVSNNSKLLGIYKEAKNYVESEVKYSGDAASKLPKITLKTTNEEMNSTSDAGTYISDKVTLSGMVANYGGGLSSLNGDTTYTITVSASGGANAVICKNATGTDCSEGTTRTLSKPGAADSAFYVKVSGANADTTVTVKAVGSNGSRYNSCVRYDPAYYTYQIVIVGGTTSFNRKASATLVFTVPGNQGHRITIKKVDESGNALSGSQLALYRVNKDDDSNTQVGAILANNNGNSSFKYTSNDGDDFFKYKYCIKETKAPSGYKIRDPRCWDVSKKGSVCYNSQGVEVDNEYCAATTLACSTGELENGSCKTKTEEVNPEAYTCPDGTGVLDQNSKECRIEIEGVSPTAIDGGTDYTCSQGSYRDGKCYNVSPAKAVCSSDSHEDGGKCVKNIFEDDKLICKNGDSTVELKYCQKGNEQYTLVTRSGDNVTISVDNTQTSVLISKKSIAGSEEIPGAKLKICAEKPNEKGECTAVKLVQKGLTCPSVDDEASDAVSASGCVFYAASDSRTIDVSWTSTDTPREWKGLETEKTYYLVEQTPPRGYIPVTIATEFMINPDGSVKKGSTSVEGNLLVINNQLSEITISKDDIATSKELPGATISICESYKDKDGNVQMSVSDEGECTVATLADGSSATWTSSEEPHKVVGLPIGTYVLVERIAPEGYSTAESIIFTLNADGSLSDANGNSLKDKKIVMHDKKIGDVKTGMFGYYVIFMILTIGVVGGFGSYYYLKKKKKIL